MEKEIQPLVYPTNEIIFGITKDGVVIDNLNKTEDSNLAATFFSALHQFFEDLDINNPVVMAHLVIYLMSDMAIKPMLKAKIDSFVKNEHR